MGLLFQSEINGCDSGGSLNPKPCAGRGIGVGEARRRITIMFFWCHNCHGQFMCSPLIATYLCMTTRLHVHFHFISILLLEQNAIVHYQTILLYQCFAI